MESGNIGDWEQDITSISDEELAQKLRELGANIGPITNSTRTVYQRKLQRWLKHGPGPSADSSSSQLSLDDSYLEASHVQMESAAVTTPPKRATADRAKNRVGQEYSQTDGYATAMPLHSEEHFRETVKGSPDQKVSHAARSLPAVSQEDIDLVDRVMASGPASYQQTPSRTYQESTRDLAGDESGLRSRYSVTPRPSLQSYKESTGYKPSYDSFQSGQSSKVNTSRVHQSDQATGDGPKSSSKFGKVVLAIFVIAALLLFIAVYYNMEPAYRAPLK